LYKFRDLFWGGIVAGMEYQKIQIGDILIGLVVSV